MPSAEPGTATLHVDAARLDRMLDLVSELVIARGALLEHAREARTLHGVRSQVRSLLEVAERVGRLTEEIQGRVLKARTMPVGGVLRRFANVVKHYEESSGKQVGFKIHGERTEVDKRAVDELAEPLVHLVRNALAHGIETPDERLAAGKPAKASLHLIAYHEGDQLVIEVEDDGRGIDIERVLARAKEVGIVSADRARQMSPAEVIELLFDPRLSTAERLTQMAGRGVGLDAARQTIERLGGTLELLSSPLRGCRAMVRIPLSLAIVRVLLVGVGDEIYAVPAEQVAAGRRISPEDVEVVEGHEVLQIGQRTIPLVHLGAWLGGSAGSGRLVVIVRVGLTEVALAVDRLLRQQDVVLKPLPRRLARLRGFTGASIGGDRQVILVIDPYALCQGVRRERRRIGEPFEQSEGPNP